MNAMFRLGATAMLLIAAIGVTSCDRRPRVERIELPETPIVAVRDRWGVVSGSYVRVREEPRPDAPIKDYVRRGIVVEVTEVIERRSGSGEGGWFRIADEGVDGWVRESAVTLYESRARAENASRQVLNRGADE
ncbi:MAG: SH3 domain-containing protein [Spirochaetota bacterium]